MNNVGSDFICKLGQPSQVPHISRERVVGDIDANDPNPLSIQIE
jgi:hypothetical protein